MPGHNPWAQKKNNNKHRGKNSTGEASQVAAGQILLLLAPGSDRLKIWQLFIRGQEPKRNIQSTFHGPRSVNLRRRLGICYIRLCRSVALREGLVCASSLIVAGTASHVMRSQPNKLHSDEGGRPTDQQPPAHQSSTATCTRWVNVTTWTAQ
jgi:hypothetical protein